MITLKEYQSRALDSLRAFLRDCSRHGDPAAAFQRVQEANLGIADRYLPIQAAGLSAQMPYVCLRVPTGGGKTLMACHAAGIAMTELLHAERAIILWLVHRSTILKQTSDALNDSRHPYRRALEMSCAGPVEVVTIDDALQLSRATVDGQTTVIVASIQAFRVEDTTGRRVYDQNGQFAEHMQNPPADRALDLLPGADGKPKPSLVNMLRLRRPIVIMDEAHNARTPLSFSTLGSVLPSCILEFTATPSIEPPSPSNILHHVSAAELKHAQMVKLPLRVVTRHPSQKKELLDDAIRLRNDLEKLAVAESQLTSEYIRPILLIQPSRVDECEPVREQLIQDFNIPKEQIKISVGKLDELKDEKDIAASSCPIRYILTVEKLREGWDCPFAYVLCSLKETRSATAIEQIVGRILRLPRASLKAHADLNCAYAYSVSESIEEVLAELRDALQSNGFTAAEAQRIILPAPQGLLPLGYVPGIAHVAPEQIDLGAVKALGPELENKAAVNTVKGEISIFVPLDSSDIERLQRCVTTPEAKMEIAAVAEAVRERDKALGGTGRPRTPSPYELGVPFRVPLLSINEHGSLFDFDETVLLEHAWKLSEKDASLSDAYNPLDRPKGTLGLVDIDAKSHIVTTRTQEDNERNFVALLHQHVMEFDLEEQWTTESLVTWLDRHLFVSEDQRREITEGESAEFSRKVILGLMAKFAIEDVSVLALDRFRLRDEIERRINQHRDEEHEKAFQALLFPDSQLRVDDRRVTDFRTVEYEPSWLYSGSHQFTKHFFGPKPGELKEKRADGSPTAEFKCAAYLDSRPYVKHWMRNVPRKSSSFRLHTAKDWFYPDFVCQLQDDRVLVVEYKGEHLYADAENKRLVGNVWESRSGGKCLFVMPTAGDLSIIDRKAQTLANPAV